MIRSLFAAVLLCAWPAIAHAQDDDLPEAGDLSFDDDLLDDEPATLTQAEGEDTDEAYRAQLDSLDASSPEEVLSAWEAYLVQYPNTRYRQQIARHIGQAEASMYTNDIDRGDVEKVDLRGLRVPETAMGENINPATRVKFGFDWGVPDYINLIGDVEYAFTPQLSVHGAMRKRYTGWSAETGARFALVKSESAGLLVTGIGDVRYNINPGYVGIRPQLGAAKRLFDKVWVQGQGGVEWEHFGGFWSSRWMADANISLRANERVSMYVEGNFQSKYPNWPGGAFYYHLVGFGMRFYPGDPSKSSQDSTDVLLGASVPAAYNYWRFHTGSATVQGNLYLD